MTVLSHLRARKYRQVFKPYHLETSENCQVSLKLQNNNRTLSKVNNSVITAWVN